ncbi:FHA domain-containing protein [Candidatus Poribacteria bacterium]|nr:FHA domain-containing protein [Candidatus Poribacteria bacterium]
MKKIKALISLFVILFVFLTFNCFAQNNNTQPNADLCFVIDVSGNMTDDDTVSLINNITAKTLKSVSANSRICFIKFSAKPELVIPFTNISEEDMLDKFKQTFASSETEKPAQARNIVVKKGDTLWDLSVKYYGNPFLWRKIAEVNNISRSKESDIPVGTKIIIPDLERKLHIDSPENSEHSNIPSAIERAIYELKQNGRADSSKSIILITNGLINIEDSPKAVEKYRWLKEDLAKESKNAGIKIFSFLFHENAEFELMQTLAQRTGGDYYRIKQTENITPAVNSMIKILHKTEEKPTPQPLVKQKVVKDEKAGIPLSLIIASAAGLVILGSAAAFVLTKKRKGSGVSKGKIPEACLVDVEGVTDNNTYIIDKPFVTIGRLKGDNVDIVINQSTVSSTHAQIRYRDRRFYLVDLGSTNGTYLNEEKDRITGEVSLESGDIIILDQYKFRFMIRGKASQHKTTDKRQVVKPQTQTVQPPKSGVTQINPAHRTGTMISTGKNDESAKDIKMPEAYLVDTGSVTGERMYRISKPLMRIGRLNREDIDIIIEKNTVSAIHAQIEYKNNKFFISDLGSRNGTYLNDTKEKITTETELNCNDILYFDQYRFKFLVRGQNDQNKTEISVKSNQTTTS